MRYEDRLLYTRSPFSHFTSIKSLVAFGDSWTDAKWAHVRDSGEWYQKPVNYISHWTTAIGREMGINVDNQGYAGKLARDLAVGTEAPYMQRVLDKFPSHVLVMAGGNDVYNNYTVDQIMEYLRIIHYVMTANNIKVIMMWYPISAVDGLDVITKAEQWKRFVELRSRIADFSLINKCLFVDFWNTPLYNGVDGVNRQYYMPDGVHLNATGMPIVTSYLMSKINKGGI